MSFTLRPTELQPPARERARLGLTLACGLALAPMAIAAEPIGDLRRGLEVFLDRELGHCVLCHEAVQVDAPFQGNLGPDLSDLGLRMEAGEIRAKVMDPTVGNPQSAMPAFHRANGLRQVAAPYVGKPILDAGQMADLVAFLAGLRAEGGERGDNSGGGP